MDLIIIYPKPYSIYLRGTIGSRASGSNRGWGLGLIKGLGYGDGLGLTSVVFRGYGLEGVGFREYGCEIGV